MRRSTADEAEIFLDLPDGMEPLKLQKGVCDFIIQSWRSEARAQAQCLSIYDAWSLEPKITEYGELSFSLKPIGEEEFTDIGRLVMRPSNTDGQPALVPSQFPPGTRPDRRYKDRCFDDEARHVIWQALLRKVAVIAAIN